MADILRAEPKSLATPMLSPEELSALDLAEEQIGRAQTLDAELK